MITSKLRFQRRRDTAMRRAAPSFLAVALVSSLLVASPIQSALALTPSNGVMTAANATIPRGAIFLSDGQGGHWWVGDSNLGLCRLDSQNVAGRPPFFENGCTGAVKNGGGIVVGPSAVAGNRALYVADTSSKSNAVARFQFIPGAPGQAGSVSSPLVMQVPNPTFVGGGSGGGRAVALALAPNGADLYVGYLKSGDVMKITGAQTTASLTPPVAKIGTTSDGKGVNAFVLFGNDLYLAELGGFGLSRIADPSGVARSACTATAVCKAVTVSPVPSFFPGGLATDGTSIFIGDAGITGANNSVLRYNPVTGVVDQYSLNVNPSYVSDGVSYTTYVGPLGLGYNAATGDLLVGDDPQFNVAVPNLQRGHFWTVSAPAVAVVPSVTSVAPTSGSTAGGAVVTIIGTNFSTGAGGTTVSFGANAGLNVSCASATSCSATSPAGSGTVDVRVTVAGQTSPTSAADQFSYVVANPNAVTITSVTPTVGSTLGGTSVAIVGTNFTVGGTTINFGANAATNVVCASTTTCSATSPAAAAGIVDVALTDINGTSAATAADQFTYATPTATFYAWGITAPKGGAVWLPGALGGHWWSSDHAQGLCRQDPMSSAPAPFTIAGDTNHAINFAVCGDDLVGSAGQAVYDPRLNADGTHYVYVPDNAVKSTAVWRLTFNPATETMVPDPLGGAMATAMTPLADVRTLKPNGMALGPDGNLYVTDLVDPNVRRITNPNADPRTQTITIVAVTGDGRGANGTQGFIGNLLYVSGNRAAQFFDITRCPLAAGPCGMASVPAPTGVFVAGTATDPVHGFVYFTDSPGGASAGIYRYDASHDAYVAFAPGTYAPDAFGVVHCALCTFGSQAQLYVSGGTLPAQGTPNGTVTCALTCVRPWDTINHPTTATGFSFAFGLGTDPSGNVTITEDPSAGARSGRGTMWIVPFLP